MAKKELKARIKFMRQEYLKKGLIAPYVSLVNASEAELEAWIERASKELTEPEEPEPEPEPETQEADLGALMEAKTLSELGRIIEALGGKAPWHNWRFSLWTKNGQCRVYFSDHSYRNPKDRGYWLIGADGIVQSFFHKGNFEKPPSLPPLPATTNDLVAKSLDPHQRAVASLDRQFGQGGWDKLDLEDELEREEYQ